MKITTHLEEDVDARVVQEQALEKEDDFNATQVMEDAYDFYDNGGDWQGSLDNWTEQCAEEAVRISMKEEPVEAEAVTVCPFSSGSGVEDEMPPLESECGSDDQGGEADEELREDGYDSDKDSEDEEDWDVLETFWALQKMSRVASEGENPDTDQRKEPTSRRSPPQMPKELTVPDFLFTEGEGERAEAEERMQHQQFWNDIVRHAPPGAEPD